MPTHQTMDPDNLASLDLFTPFKVEADSDSNMFDSDSNAALCDFTQQLAANAEHGKDFGDFLFNDLEYTDIPGITDSHLDAFVCNVQAKRLACGVAADDYVPSVDLHNLTSFAANDIDSQMLNLQNCSSELTLNQCAADEETTASTFEFDQNCYSELNTSSDDVYFKHESISEGDESNASQDMFDDDHEISFRNCFVMLDRLDENDFNAPNVDLEMLQTLSSDSPANSRQNFQCRYCQKELPNLFILEFHENRHTQHMLKISECGDLNGHSDNILTSRSNESDFELERPFKCPRCDLRFKRLFHLQCHERVHTGERPYKCPHCEVAFKQLSHLRRHLLVHTGEKSYHCSLCNKSFACKNDVTRHERRHAEQGLETTSFDNGCEAEPGPETPKPTQKNGHEKLNTKPKQEKPIKPKLAQETPPSKNCIDDKHELHKAVREKVKIHIVKGRDKHFIQQKQVKTTTEQQRHDTVLIGEKPYKCSHCDATFMRKSSVVRHERKHTGYRPFKCSVCELAFTESSSLRRHELRIHMKERYYQCSQCQQRFLSKKLLKCHEQLHAEQQQQQQQLVIQEIRTDFRVPLCSETKQQIIAAICED